MNSFRFLFILPFLGLAACATMPTAPEAALPGAKVQTGQLAYMRLDSTSIIGDFQMVTGPVFRVDFFKGPSSPLISVVRDGDQARIEGSMAGPGWSGKASDAPKEAQAWVHLANAFQPFGSLPEDPQRPLFKIVRNEGPGDDGSIEVEFPLTGEDFRFYFD